MQKRKFGIAVTGASGSIYAKRLLGYMERLEDVEIGLVFSKNAKTVWELELQERIPDFRNTTVYEHGDYFSPLASGSSRYEALAIIPCSMGTIGRIAQGVSDDLICRAADVMLKERRKLICVIRESPLHQIHLKNLLQITEAGGIILPAAPSFYSLPKSIEQLVDTIVFRVLDLLNVDNQSFRWGEV